MWCQCAIPLIWTRPNIYDERSLRGLIRVIRLSTGRGRDVLYKTTQTTFPYHLLIKRLYFCTLGTRLQDEHVVEFQYCQSLEKLTMKGNKYVSARALTELIKGKDKLVVVELGETRIDDQALAALGRECPELVGLSIPDCHHFTPLGLIAFAQSGPKKIRRLKLSRSIGVTTAGISAIVKVCPNLLEIELAGTPEVTDSALIDIWLNGSRLRELDLQGSDKLTSKGFPVLSELRVRGDISEPPLADEMNSIGPRDSDSKTVPPDVDYSVFSTLPRSVPAALNLTALRVVDMEGCAGLTDEAVDSLTWNARWIRAITLAKCTQLTDAALLSLCRLGKHLHHVHLGHVPK
jgi:F-box and leucine-rich repeat protein GRR1